MRFAVVVSAPPEPGAQPLRLVDALLAGGHAVSRVFFLRDGVRHGEAGSAMANAWAALQARHPALELALCVGAAERRGMPAPATDLGEVGAAGAHAGTGQTTGFVHLGLGQFVSALAEADRVVDFPA